MATVVLKERQFEPTGRSLGSFESKDLETFDIQFQEDDVDTTPQEGGKQQGPVSHVPNPIDNDPLDKKNQQKGGGSGDGPSKNPDLDDTKDNTPEEPQSNIPQVPDEWDVMGDNPDDQDYDIPDPSDSDNDIPGGGSGDDSDGSSIPQAADPNDDNTDGDDSSNSSNGDTKGNKSGSSNNGDSSDSSSDGEEGSEGGDGQGEDTQNGDESDSDNSKGDSNGGSSGDSQQGNQNGGKKDNTQTDEGDGGGDLGNGQEQQDDGNTGMTYDKDTVENTDLFDDDDDFDPAGDIQTISDLEKALDKISNAESDTAKEKRNAEAATAEKEEKNNNSSRRNPSEMRDRAEEAAAAKEILSKAIQDKKERDANSDSSTKTTESESMEDEILSELGAGKLTTLFNPNTAKDWRTQLDKLFDKATGYNIVTNPNLVNKKIEDAPPGREDFDPVVKNIVVLLDYSGSMGAVKFKEVISHIDTMLKARKMTNVTFHIFPWGTTDVGVLLGRYTRCKGAVFKKTINAKFKEGQDGTRLAPVIPLVMKKVHKPDAVIIMTDAEIYDSDSFNRSHICTSFIKKFRDKIIWALTSDARIDSITQFDPTAKARKRYIKFKKGGHD